MLKRVLEPEVMDTVEEAVDYNEMDHSQVNRVFVDDLLNFLATGFIPAKRPFKTLDVGTGTALIPLELCRRSKDFKVIGIDLAGEMLRVGQENVKQAKQTDRIELRLVDAKDLPAGEQYPVVMSNSIIHHIPEPRTVFEQMWRVLLPGGGWFIRDLLRPESERELDRLVELHAGGANPHQQQMFRDSLHAALSLDELRELLTSLGLSAAGLRQTTDRHWTLSGWKPV